MNNWWYLFRCGSAECLSKDITFSVRTPNQIKSAACPICLRVCDNPFKWVADVDGGGGPDEPVVAYVRNTITKVRNDIHHSRKDIIDLSKKAAVKLEALYSLAKQKWDEAAQAENNGEKHE